jgi:hypothetical protein
MELQDSSKVGVLVDEEVLGARAVPLPLVRPEYRV